MILLIDNYDSFVYNLARYVVDLGESATVRRNDTITVSDIDNAFHEDSDITPRIIGKVFEVSYCGNIFFPTGKLNIDGLK